ncbi:MAG: hypothetical protein U1E86_26045 [Burkholderiaceae bacterium]
MALAAAPGVFGAQAPATGASAPPTQAAPPGAAGVHASVFQALIALADGEPVTEARAREFFLRVRAIADAGDGGPGRTVWSVLQQTRETYQHSPEWTKVGRVENQLVARVRDAVVDARSQVIRAGNLRTAFAFLDSGKWRIRAQADLTFKSDFDTTLFADDPTDVEKGAGKDNFLTRVEAALATRLGLASGQLGVELTGFGFEAQGDNFVSTTGIKWALRDSASHIHLIDPAGGRIGTNLAQHPNVLFARMQQVALRARHPDLFDASGRLLPGTSPADVRRRLLAEPGLSRMERMFAQGTAMNVLDAAIGPIDMACHVTQDRGRAEDIPKIAKQVGRSTAVFVEGMGGGEGPLQTFTPEERAFMLLARRFETGQIGQGVAESEVARFVEANPDPSAWTEAQAADLDRRVEAARTQRAAVTAAQSQIARDWPAGSTHAMAVTVMKKQAQAGFDAALKSILALPAAERSRALGDLVRELKVVHEHYSGGQHVAPADILAWARTGLETATTLSEMSKEPRFGDLLAALSRTGRAGPREIARVREFLGQSEGGRRLLARVGTALDAIGQPAGEPALGHPLADAARGLRDIAGGYTAIVGHLALAFGLADLAAQAKTNEELVTGLVQTLISTTTWGMVFDEGRKFVFDGDNLALARLLSYSLVPETMLPALVEALGRSAINLGSAIAFDTQLDALYRVSRFDEGHRLLDIGGYLKADLAQMLVDIVDTPGGARFLEDMIGRAVKDSDTLLAEQAKGIDAAMKSTVVRVLEQTLEKGNPLAFRDDATLVAIGANVRKYQDEIAFVARGFGVAPDPQTDANAFYRDAFDARRLVAIEPRDTARRAPERPGWTASLDPGQLRALAQLHVSRDGWRIEARKAFLATLVRTLEERRRAEADVDDQTRDAKRAELAAILGELDIVDAGTASYEQEAGYHLVRRVWNVTLGFATPRERAVHEMKALNRYLDAYGRVRELRAAIEAEVSRRTGRSAVPRPLTSMVSLVGVPAIDLPAASQFAEKVAPLGDALSRTLAGLKRAPLEGPYDTAMYARIYQAQYEGEYWFAFAQSAGALDRQLSVWKVWNLGRKIDLAALAREGYERSAAARKLAQDLIEEFRLHYQKPDDPPKPPAATADPAPSGPGPDDGSGGVALAAPKEVLAFQVFDVDAQPHAGIAARVAGYEWGGSAAPPAGPSKTVKWQFGHSSGGKPVDERIEVRATDAAKSTLGHGRTSVRVRPVTFAGSVPGSWEGGATDGRVAFKRRAAEAGPFAADCTKPSAKVWAEVGASLISDPFRPRTAEDLAAAIEREAVGHRQSGREVTVTAISIGGFKGQLVETKVRFVPGAWTGMGFRSSDVGATGHGYALNGPYQMELGYSVGGAGCFNNSDRAFLQSQAASAQQEARGVLAGLSLVADGRFATTPYTGPKLDGSDLPTLALVPARLEKLRVGDTVKVSVEVANAKPEDLPLRYAWTGTFDARSNDPAQPATVTLRPDKSGKFDLSVSVDGQRFPIGSASLQYEVADYKVVAARVPAEDKPVPVGVRIALTATLTVDGKPASGPFKYRWQPLTEAAFDRLDANVPDVGVTFSKPGRAKVWVEVLENREGREATVAASAPLEFDVVAPKLELSFEPPEPWVGQDVKARIAVEPESKDIDFRWMPVPANARQSLQGPDGRSITFYLTDDRPAPIQVLARVPVSGETLGEAGRPVQAKKYAIEVTGPKAMGPKPRIFRDGAFVDVDKEIAVDQVVEFAVGTSPAALTAPLRYQWTVTAGSCTVSNPTSREARASASAAGGCELAVVVRDRNGVTLGDGKASFSATITREAIAAGQTKAKEAADAKTRLESANAKERAGDVDGALRDAEDAAKLDPANRDAADAVRRLRQAKATIEQQIAKARALMDENRFADAERELKVAAHLSRHSAAVQQTQKELTERWAKYNLAVRDKTDEVRAAIDAKQFGRALDVAAAWRASTKLDAATDGELRVLEERARQRKAQKDHQAGILKAAAERARQLDYAGALQGFEAGFANGQALFDGTEPEYREAVELRTQVLAKTKRLDELIPWIRRAAEDPAPVPPDVLAAALANADEAIALQPRDERLVPWRGAIVARMARLKEDAERRDAQAAAERQRRQRGAQLWGEGKALFDAGRASEALEKFKASVGAWPEPANVQYVAQLEATLAANRARAQQLRNEGEALQGQSKLPEAVAKYRESLALLPDPALQAHVARVETQIAADRQRRQRAAQLWSEGKALFDAGRAGEALAKFRESVGVWPEPANVQYVSQLDASIAANRTRAQQLRAEGEALQNQSRLPEAVAKYRESLALLPDAALQAHVARVEAQIAADRQRRQQAAQAWSEGKALFDAGRARDALGKFRESLALWADPANQRYVEQLEAALAAQQSAAAQAAQAAQAAAAQAAQSAAAQAAAQAAQAAQSAAQMAQAARAGDAARAAEAARASAQRALGDPQPGLYRAGSGQTYRLGEIRGTTIDVEQWQGNGADPPQSRSQFYGRGSVTRVGSGPKWRGTLPDLKDYCCGNNLDVELEFSSSTSFRVVRWRLWPLGGTRPADDAGWQSGSDSTLNRVTPGR